MSNNELIINATLPETRVAYVEDGEIQELIIERDTDKGIVGNIYKGKVLRVLPGMQAAFVDIGHDKAAFLYVDDVFFPDMENALTTHPIPDHVPEHVLKGSGGGGSADPIDAAVDAAVGEMRSSRRERFKRGGERGRSGGRDRNERGGRGGRDRNDRNGRRGGRDQMNARGGKQQGGRRPQPQIGVYTGPTTAATNPANASSPEEHAAMQKQYGSMMQDISEEEYLAELEARRKKAEEAQSSSASVPMIDDDIGNQVPASESYASEAETVESDAPVARAYHAEDEDLSNDEQNDDVVEGEDHHKVQLNTEAWVPEVAAVAAHHDPDTEAEIPDGSVVASAIEATEVEEETDDEAAVLRTDLEDDNDEDEDDDRAPIKAMRRGRREKVNIADLLKEGQEILVQVAKDPIATKGARLTCHVSLPGRYLVFMPTVDHVGVSRRIESDQERRRLKYTINAVRPAKTGVIVRTASGKQTDQKLKLDLDYLVETWNEIQEKFKKQKPGTAVYTDLSVPLRAIRDVVGDDVDKIVVDSTREFKTIGKFLGRFMPHLKDKLVQHQGKMPIFDHFGIEVEIERALERRVWLKSGGYLVVDQAEALVAIDVNTGRFVGKKNLEETIVKTNLEAVKEIAYQIRIRNCGGIIILDLIDMEKESNKERVYKALEEELKKDRARPTIMRISQLGLIEMTRKRTRDTIVRSLCQPCAHCKGKSFTKNVLTVSYDILRDIEREGYSTETSSISIQCNPEVADILQGDKSDVIANLEQEFGKSISIRSNGAYPLESYEIVCNTEDGKSETLTSEERRQKVRQKISAHMQVLAAEQRKVREAEMAEKRRHDIEERRAQRASQQVPQEPEVKLFADEDMSSDAQRWRFFQTNRLKRSNRPNAAAAAAPRAEATGEGEAQSQRHARAAEAMPAPTGPSTAEVLADSTIEPRRKFFDSFKKRNERPAHRTSEQGAYEQIQSSEKYPNDADVTSEVLADEGSTARREHSDRGDRGPRRDRGDRGDRGGRGRDSGRGRDRGDRGEREDRGNRGNRDSSDSRAPKLSKWDLIKQKYMNEGKGTAEAPAQAAAPTGSNDDDNAGNR